MCLPAKSTESTSPPTSQARSIVGVGALMVLACVGGPAISGALGALGAGALVGAGGAIAAVVVCLALPTAMAAWRRHARRRADAGAVDA
jgi:hypothetical protein